MSAPIRRAEAELGSMFEHTGGTTGAFTSKAADYAISRPDYPAALFEALHLYRALFPGARVADIGAGTGLLTDQLLRLGYPVIAVEPNAAMLAIADQLLSGFQNYRGVAGSAEATTLEAASVDLVAVAQAFHWFDVAAVRREWLRILTPKGRVLLVWNTRPLEDRLQRAIDEVLDKFGGDKHTLLAAQQELSTVPPFFAGASFDQVDLPHAQDLAREGFLSLVLSRSSMPDRNTPAGRRAEQVLSDLFDVHARAGKVTVNYRTVAFIGRPNAVATDAEGAA